MDFAPLLLLLIPLVGVGLYLAWKAEQQRREKLHAYALSNGWTFHHADPYGLEHRWSGDPFDRGHSRHVRNVIEGVSAGRSFLSFDYRFSETSGSGKSRHTTTYHFHVTAVALPVQLPDLYVGHENLLTRFGSALGLDDIEFESDEFNRQFRVQSSEPKFAHDVLHPRTMQELLHVDCPTLRLEGSDCLVSSSGKAVPDVLVHHLAAVRTFVDGIPAFVWRDYGYDPGTAIGPGGTG